MMLGDLILLFVVLPILIVCSGLISGSETAFFGLGQADRLALRRGNPRALAAIEALLKKPRPLLTAILLANMLINVFYFTLSSLVVLNLETAHHTGLAVGVAGGSLLALILFGEVTAKMIASTHRVMFCRIGAMPWLVLLRSTWPVWSFVDRGVIAPLTRLFSPSDGGQGRISALELEHLLQTPNQEQSIDPYEQRLLVDVLRLGALSARDVLTPRVELDTLPADADDSRLVSYIRTHQPEQILLMNNNGSPAGFLSPTRYLAELYKSPAGALDRSVEPPMFVPEQARLDALLELLRLEGKERAAVVDERGELVGVVRVEDVVAELIDAAADPDEAEGEVQLIGLGRFSVPGRFPARALVEDFDPRAVDESDLLGRVTTIGGVVLALLGRLPEVGDVVQLGHLRLRVAELHGRAIERVEVELSEPGPGGRS